MQEASGPQATGPQPTGPLKGLRVLDLTRVLAGPTCTQMLGDLGAEVIKIERPEAGDDTRGFAPPFVPNTRESAYFVGVNRNKKSVTLDISKPEGQAIIHRLLESCDILAENFKVGALAKVRPWLGAAFAEVSAADLLLDHRLRPDRPLCAAPGLRRADPGHGRRHVPHRGARWLAAEGRRAGRRPVRRALRLHRHAGGGEPPSRHRAGPADRHRHARHARRLAGQPGHELPGYRREPAAARQPAPEHRALPGIPHQGRLHHPRRRQRPDLRALLQGQSVWSIC